MRQDPRLSATLGAIHLRCSNPRVVRTEWRPSPGASECDLIWKQGLGRGHRGKVKWVKWVLTQKDWCPSVKGTFGHRENAMPRDADRRGASPFADRHARRPAKRQRLGEGLRRGLPWNLRKEPAPSAP